MLSSLINESVTDAVHGFTGNARTTPSRGMEVVNGDSAPRDVKVRCFCQLMLVDRQVVKDVVIYVLYGFGGRVETSVKQGRHFIDKI